MSELNQYHSYYAEIRQNRRCGPVVRIIDRYYPGPPGPEYSGILDLEPFEAHHLGLSLIEEAKKARALMEKTKVDAAIAENTTKIAAAAKSECE